MEITRRGVIRAAAGGGIGLSAGCQQIKGRVFGERSHQLVYLGLRDWTEGGRILGLVMAAAVANCGSRTAQISIHGGVQREGERQYTEDGSMTIVPPDWSYELFYLGEAFLEEGTDGSFTPVVQIEDGQWLGPEDVEEVNCDVEVDPREIWEDEDTTRTPTDTPS